MAVAAAAHMQVAAAALISEAVRAAVVLEAALAAVGAEAAVVAVAADVVWAACGWELRAWAVQPALEAAAMGSVLGSLDQRLLLGGRGR
jgi:hypothetical protein